MQSLLLTGQPAYVELSKHSRANEAKVFEGRAVLINCIVCDRYVRILSIDELPISLIQGLDWHFSCAPIQTSRNEPEC